jgi:hypothetical protein
MTVDQQDVIRDKYGASRLWKLKESQVRGRV